MFYRYSFQFYTNPGQMLLKLIHKIRYSFFQINEEYFIIIKTIKICNDRNETNLYINILKNIKTLFLYNKCNGKHNMFPFCKRYLFRACIIHTAHKKYKLQLWILIFKHIGISKMFSKIYILCNLKR